MNPATLDATLRGLGSAPVTVPDLDQLEARLLAAIDTPPRVDLGQRRRRRTAPLLIGAVAACLLALVVLAAGWFAAGDDPYVLAAAVDVEVVLPDGDVVAGTVGLEVPIGSVLSVGGSMEIDGTTYGPGDYVITDDGPVAVEAGGGGDGPSEDVVGGDDGGGTPAVGTSTTEPVRPADGLDEVEAPSTSRPPATTGPVPTTTAVPAVGDTRPTVATDRTTTTAAPDRPPRVTTTTTTAPRDPPPKVTTTTTAPRDPRPRDTTSTRPPRDRS